MLPTVSIKISQSKIDNIIKKLENVTRNINNGAEVGLVKSAKQISRKANTILREKKGTGRWGSWEAQAGGEPKIEDSWNTSIRHEVNEVMVTLYNTSPHAGYREASTACKVYPREHNGLFPIGKSQGMKPVAYARYIELQPGYHYLQTAINSEASSILGVLSPVGNIVKREVIANIRSSVWRLKK